MATKIYSTSYPENPPEWYWTKGLRDAGITEVESFEFPFDYNKTILDRCVEVKRILIASINMAKEGET